MQLASKLPMRPKGEAVKPKAEMGPLTELTPKHRLLIDYVVNGVPPNKAHLLDYLNRATPSENNPNASRPLVPGEPLRIEEAARVLGFRLRHARHLFTQPVFLKAHAAAVEAIRNGSKVDAIRKVVEVLHDNGDGSAAFRKVQLSAAQMLLQDQDPQAKTGVTVNVGLNLTAGVVVRLPPDAPQAPLELQAEPDDR